MREIKFRAWDGENKTVRQVEELSFEKDGSIHGLLSKERGKDVGRVYLGQPTMVDVGNKNHPEGWLDDYPLMQYTGLKDKTGREIYEGDIVRYETEDGDVWTAQIIWDTGEENIFISGFKAQPIHDITDEIYDDNGNPPLGWTGEIEVIGNIYENPELLEGK
jgi:uncharacterized phage protein (TIGR01671 family)